MKLDEKTIEKKYIYKGRIINVRTDTAELPNGKQALREVVEHPGGVTVAALTDNDELMFVRQFRYPYSEVLLELPAGKLEYGEDPFEAGKRELREETGIDAAPEELHLLGSIREPSAFSDCYLVRRTLPADSLTLQEGETDAACWVSFWRFETMIHEGLIPPPVALRYGAMLAALQAEVGRDAWLEPEPGSGREDNA